MNARVAAALHDGVAGYFIISGLCKLVPVVFPDLLPLDSDEAVLGLMARHLGQGEFPLFSYGQTYGGGFELLLAGALAWILPNTVVALRLAAATLALAAEYLLYRALAPAIPSRPPRLAASAMLAVGGMTYARAMSHLHGVHLNNALLFASLLFWLSRPRTRPPGAFWRGLWVGVGYWVSPFVWLLIGCAGLAAVRWWRELLRLSLPQVLWLLVGFALGALPRLVYAYAPDGWYAPYRAGGFALVRASGIPRRASELVLHTLPDYCFGQLRALGTAGAVVAGLGAIIALPLLGTAAARTWRGWRRGRQEACVPACVLLLACASVVLVVLNRRVFDSGQRYLWPVEFALAVAWAFAVEHNLRPWKSRGVAWLRGLKVAVVSIPFALGAISLFLVQRQDSHVPGTALKRAIAEQAMAEGCRVGIADYWYAYSLSLLTQEKLRLAPIYTPRILSYAQAAESALMAGKRICAVLDLSDQAQAMQPNRMLYAQLHPNAERVYRYPGEIVLMVMGSE
jgi:hypothetical protein